MVTKWTGFSPAEERYTDFIKMSLLGEEPLELFAELHPAVGADIQSLVVEVPAANASFVIRGHRKKEPEEIAKEIRLRLIALEDERQRKHLTKGYDWW